MAKLIYVANVSLDGYIEDARGAFDWAPPDDDVFSATTALLRSVGTLLYGRRLYETMAVWETNPAIAEQSDLTADFASAWRAADKVVYSGTLRAASTARTRIEHRFDAEAVLALKREGDVSVGGPGLAASAVRAGLVDEYHLYVTPVVVGGGTAVFPDGVRAGLDLLDQHRFAGGVVYLRYRAQR